MMRRVMILVVWVVLVGWAASAPSCQKVFLELSPCLAYLQGKGEPTMQCCAGVKDIGGQTQSEQDRQAVCECLKKGLSNFQYDSSKVPLLPSKCGVSISLPPITSSTDCAKVMWSDRV